MKVKTVDSQDDMKMISQQDKLATDLASIYGKTVYHTNKNMNIHAKPRVPTKMKYWF